MFAEVRFVGIGRIDLIQWRVNASKSNTRWVPVQQELQEKNVPELG